MKYENQKLRAKLKKWILFLGVLQIFVGCGIGLLPPNSVPWFRGIVISHIEFTANGVLLIAFGFLLAEMNLSAKSIIIWFSTLQLGTWTNGTAAFVAGVTGRSSPLLPTTNQSFPAPNGLDNPLVTGLLVVCGVTFIVALLLTLFGLFPARSSDE